MENSSSSSRRYVDGNHSAPNDLSRSWSSNPRPTLNTSLSNQPTSSNLSPHLSPTPSSSPWPQNQPSHYLLPEMGTRNPIQGLSAPIPPFNSEWEHLLVSPSNHDTYSTFAANSGFISLSSSPSGASHSLPRSYQNHYQAQVSNVSAASHPSSSGSWSQSQSPTQHKSTLGYPAKQLLPRSNSSSSESKGVKRMSHFTPIDLHLYSRLDDSGS